MASITIYSISVAIVFALCGVSYKAFIAGATFHKFNRAVILSIYAISLAAPLLVPILGKLSSDPASIVMPANIEIGIPMASVVAEPESPGLWRYAPIAYCFGVLLALLTTAIGIMRIVAIIRKGEKRKINGATLVVVDTDVSPFSWWRWIVVSRCDAGNDIILRHELRHVRSRHTADLMLAQAFAVFNWFNPLAWMMRTDLSAQHEYAVDSSMLRTVDDPRSYQMLIVRKAVGRNMGPLANCLHNSQLKKRVKMMLKMKTKAIRGLWAAAILPAAIGAMAILNTSAVASSLKKMVPADASAKTDTITSAIDRVQVVAYGSQKKEDSAIVFNSAPLSGVKITIDGKVASEEQMKALSPDDIADITVFRDPDRIVINTKASQAIVVEEPGEGVELPKFKAGEYEIYKRLADIMKYPADAVKENAQGMASVGFIVDTNGNASNFEIIKSTGNESLDAEAVRACREALSSDWIPGKKDGAPVAVRYVVPVNFKLQ